MRSKKAYTYTGIYAPFPVGLANRLARGPLPALERFGSLQSGNLLETASRKTGLQDYGDPRFAGALDALLDSVAQEGSLSFFGRFAVRQFLIENLCTRLRIIEACKRFPEIRQQEIQRPIWHLDALLKTFPDAVIIQLHRDPRETIPSVCSLSALARAPFCEHIDNRALGKFWLAYYEARPEARIQGPRESRRQPGDRYPLSGFEK